MHQAPHAHDHRRGKVVTGRAEAWCACVRADTMTRGGVTHHQGKPSGISHQVVEITDEGDESGSGRWGLSAYAATTTARIAPRTGCADRAPRSTRSTCAGAVRGQGLERGQRCHRLFTARSPPTPASRIPRTRCEATTAMIARSSRPWAAARIRVVHARALQADQLIRAATGPARRKRSPPSSARKVSVNV